MRWRGSSLFWLTGCATLMAQTESFAYSPDFTMVNNTDQPIVVFMASPSTESRYVPFDHVYVPAGGGSQHFTFSDDVTGDDCYMDMKFKFQGGQFNTIDHIDLCSIQTITINAYNGKVSFITDP